MPATACGGKCRAIPSVEIRELSTLLRHAPEKIDEKNTETLEKPGKICYDRGVVFKREVFHKKLSTVRGWLPSDGRYFFRLIAGRKSK